MQNDGEFLGFCLTVRSSGIAGSKRLQIRDGVLAQAFDARVALRLLKFDKQQEEINRKMLAYEVCKMAGLITVNESVGDDLPDIVRNDPWADENTVVS